MKTSIKEAIDLAGGVASIAAHFGIRPVSVYEWIRRGYAPAEKCPEIEKLSNGAARCEALNSHVDWAFVRSSHIAGVTHQQLGRRKDDQQESLFSVQGSASS